MASLSAHVRSQAAALMTVAGYDDTTAVNDILADLLATGAACDATTPPWPSDISDDHSPVEFSVALDHGQRPTVRILGEAVADDPGCEANLAAAQRLLQRWSRRYNLDLSRYEKIADLFLSTPPVSPFALWFSLVFRHQHPPQIKVYLNPQCRDAHHSWHLVAEAMQRLGLGAAHRTLASAARRPGAGFSFVALDLHHGARSRIKIYLSHTPTATAEDAVAAAVAVPGIDLDEVAQFCRLAAGDSIGHGARPLVSGFTFVQSDTDQPSGYSLYVPIRCHVTDDAQARDRALTLAHRYGHDAGLIDRAIAGVARRDLADGVGLIPHVSLRLGAHPPGLTVYLSSEAYHATAPRPGFTTA
ncbi:tryptophan dimethylallyltransferase family protein [Actinocatenispora rupis]|uniref:Prenyltransferase n=1 Tax=Actinocatenispora rupis TaxID=519421 RepID=A0A8J3J318_9ACTN|nr:tryptophan dimethylallyltransferase family protein [Actinocatenispora rupis]GID14891.1 prenyltransferase [Actinocatenispora rupis]